MAVVESEVGWPNATCAALRTLGNPLHWRLLSLVASGRDLSVSGIAAQTNHVPATVCKCMRALSAYGLVQRHRVGGAVVYRPQARPQGAGGRLRIRIELEDGGVIDVSGLVIRPAWDDR